MKALKIDIKLLAKHLIGFALLTAIAYYVIAYANFEFELPFFVRDSTYSDDSDIVLYENNAEFEVTTEPAEVENLQNIVNPEVLVDTTEQNIDNDGYKAELSATDETVPENTASTFPSINDLTAKGFYKSDGVYSSQNTQYKYEFAKVVPQYENLPTSRTIRTSAGRLNAIEPFMDYFMIRRPENVILCDWSGKIITEGLSYDESDTALKALKSRDITNNTVFSRTRTEIVTEVIDDVETDVKYTVQTYFIYDSVAKVFMQTAFNPVYGDRGVPFMYPSYYGANGTNKWHRYEVDGKWGYMTSETQEIALTHDFDMAYNFNEGIGIAYRWEERGSWRGYYNYKRLYFLNEEGGYWNNSYYAPDEVTFDHLGFFYFDHGLTRAYYREFDAQGRITVERDVIVDKEGREFYLPADYNIKAYSNGVILLEKDGYYGFMSYKGDWIAQPIFTYAEPFSEGLAVIGFNGGMKGMIDTQGNIILKFQYDHISSCVGGTIAFHDSTHGWTVLAKMRSER